MFRQKTTLFYYIMKRKYTVMEEDTRYKDIFVALNSLISNASDIKNVANRKHSRIRLDEAKKYLSRYGLAISDMEQSLSVIHVAGTKGKGSTCTFCESILRRYDIKTGLFISPHLVSVRERIQINGQPLSQSEFAHYFWDLFYALERKQEYKNDMPTYFTFLMIMAFKVFMAHKVDVAVIEVGIGGEYDTTNIFGKTAVVGITSLGFDHESLLGNTIEEISWQKSGIMKPGAIAITSANQLPMSQIVLKKRAKQKQSLLLEAPLLELYAWPYNTCIGNNGPNQHLNASLALQLANAWLHRNLYENTHERVVRKTESIPQAPAFPITKQMAEGLQNCFLPGRTQVINYSPRVAIYLEGAHNIDSINNCRLWFQQSILKINNKRNFKKILVFNVTGGRKYSTFLPILATCCFDYAFFCPNIVCELEITDSSEFEAQMEQCRDIRDEYLKISKDSSKENVQIFNNVYDTLSHVIKLERATLCDYHVLITGSLYLVGAVLKILDPDLKGTVDKIDKNKKPYYSAIS